MSISLKNISKKYKSKEALSNVNLTFASKGMVMLTGENGSGKTTLLNIIGLLDDNYLGEISLNNIAISELKNNEVHQLRGSIYNFIFQESNLIEDITVKDNLSIYKNMKGIDANETSFINNVESLLTKYPKTLSGGERQKIAITRGLYDGEIILCDEPVASLDYQSTKEVMDKLKEISKTKLVIVVMHAKSLVEKYADRIIELKNGVVISDNEITKTEELDLSVEAKKINIKYGLSKLISSFFKKRAIKSFMFLFLLTVMINLLTLLFSLQMYNPVPLFASKLAAGGTISLSRVINVEYKPTNENAYFKYTNGSIIYSDVSREFSKEEFDFIIDTNFGPINFTDTLNIEKGQVVVDLDTYYKITSSTTFSLGHTLNIQNEAAKIDNFQLDIVGISDKKGLYASKASLDRNLMTTNKLALAGGMFLNDKMLSPLSYYSQETLYMPLSYAKKELLDHIQKDDFLTEDAYRTVQKTISELHLEYNQIGISQNLKTYLAEDFNTDSTLTFHDFSIYGSEFKNQFVDLNKSIFPNGVMLECIMKDYSETFGRSFIVVNDQAFKDILSYVPCYNRININIAESNKHKIAVFLLNNDFTLVDRTLSYIKGAPKMIEDLQPLIIGVTVILSISLFIIMCLLISTILLAKKNEIGLLQSFGFSKVTSLLPSLMVILILLSASLIISFSLSPGIFEFVNGIMARQSGHDTIIFNLRAKLIILITIFVILLFFLSYLFNYKKIKKYSAKEMFHIS